MAQPGAGASGRPRCALLLLGLGTVIIIALAVLGVSGPSEVQNVAETLNQPGGYGEVNRALAAVVVGGLLLVVPLLLVVYLHNSLVAKEEDVSARWAQTESNLQRRADLIPMLVQTVSRYIGHERDTLTELVDGRTQGSEDLRSAIEALTEAQQETNDLLRAGTGAPIEDEARLQHLFTAQQAVAGRLGNILAVAEAYPELRSSDQFLELQAQLEGTENRINVARQRFNEAVGEYNATLRMLPWNVFAALGGFRRKAYFQAADDAGTAPTLAFH